MSMMDDALGLLATGLQAGLGKAVIYQRGALSQVVTLIAQGNRDQEYAVRLGATPDSTDYVIFTPEVGYCGFTMMVADVSAQIGMPQRGDKITIGTDTYTCLAIDGAGPWRWEDLPWKTMIRIHAKLG